MAALLEVFSLPLGPLQANCFIVVQGKTGLVIDPGDEADVVVQAFKDFGFPPAAVLITHGHFDHFGGVAPLAAHFDIPVYVGEQDIAEMAQGGLGALAGHQVTPVRDAQKLSGEEELDLPIPTSVVPTPGHSLGSVTFVMGDTHLFVGDLLFNGSVGRTDLPGGNMDQLLASVAVLVRRFPPDSLVHPGHGPDTSLGRELALNPFLSPLRRDPKHRW
jgi:glyoxylase-like metal-dependent hydrolase (beta-lactamase superfamily II)